MDLSAGPAETSLDMDLLLLSQWCSTHQRLGSDALPIDILWKPPLDTMCDMFLSEAIKATKMEHGEPLYVEVVHPAIGRAIATLEAAFITLHVVEPEVVTNKGNLLEVCPMLIMQPPVEGLAMNLVGDEDAINMMDKQPHNSILKKLRKFVEVIGATEFDLACMKSVGGNAKVPANNALLYLTVCCKVLDTAIAASTLHKQFIVKAIPDASLLSTAKLMSACPMILACLDTLLVDLAGMLESESVKVLEGQLWHVSTPLASIRTWQAAVAAFAGMARSKMVQLWLATLADETSQCRSICPSWQVAFENNEFKESMAFFITQGKLATVCKAYNNLHDLLRQINDAAAHISLTPRLQEHPVAKDGIAVALHCLKDTLATTTVLEGLDLLRQFGHQTSGVTKAAAFLKQHPPGNRAGVPELLWAKLHALSTEGVSAVAAPAQRQETPPAGAASSSRDCVGSQAAGSSGEQGVKSGHSALTVRLPGAAGAKREASKSEPGSESKSKLRRMRSKVAP